MHDALVLAGLAGLGLGAVFFGGLWWTIRKALSSPRPAAWFFSSLLLRMSALLAGLYLVGHEHADRLIVCLLGIVVARLVVMRLTRPGGRPGPLRAAEIRHAP